MNNPFRTPMWQQMIREGNMLTPNEFGMSMTDINGTFVKLEEINDMIKTGVLTVDFDKLEKRIYDRTIITL